MTFNFKLILGPPACRDSRQAPNSPYAGRCRPIRPAPDARWNAQAKASEEQPYTGGDIWLVDAATGKNRLCNDYDVTQQSCRVWAHTVHHSVPKKKSVPSGETSHTAASPAPAPAVAETEKKEKSK